MPVPVSASDDPFCKAKDLCRDNGIYTLASLAVLMHVQKGRTVAQLARLTGQSDSSVSQWIAQFANFGLVVRGGRSRTAEMTLSPEGKSLAAQVRALLSAVNPNLPIQ